MIEPKRAYCLAKTHAPIAWQEFRSYFDYPVDVFLGDPNWAFPDALKRPPTAYYWARTDEKFYYIGYAFYHAQDWAAFPAKILPGEEHRHDFEGCLCRIPYYLPHHAPKRGIDYITVHHHDLLTFSAPKAKRPAIFIEAGGHGIEGLPDLAGKNVLQIEDWRLLPITYIMEPEWKREIIRREFNANGVNLPDQWPSAGQHKGWFWSRPDELFAELFLL